MTEAASTAPVTWRDYYELTKPNVVLLMLLTSVIGMFLAADGMVAWQVLVFGNLGIALCAGSAAAVNHLVDQRIDAVMARTTNRPIATGKIPNHFAMLFAAALGVSGMAILIIFINELTAWLTLASLLGYAVVYTLWLKRATPQNIVIGGLAGAAPPLLGWTSVTGQVDGNGLLLVMIIFAWTPPHFWALAIAKKEEYAKVDVPMLPVTHGDKYTRVHIMLYTLIMFAVTLLPFATRMSSWLYLAAAIALGLVFIYWAVVLLINKNPKAPMATFKYSILYLMLLFLVMLIDHWLIAPLPANVSIMVG